MEDLDVLDELSVETGPPKRSTFLMVLCILTWVGSGIQLIIWVIYLWLFAVIKQLTDGGPQDLRHVTGWAVFMLIVAIIAQVFTIVGAVLMWQLRRIGYFVYLIGELSPVLLLIYLMMSEGAAIIAIFWAIVPVAFSILYGLQWKQLYR